MNDTALNIKHLKKLVRKNQGLLRKVKNLTQFANIPLENSRILASDLATKLENPDLKIRKTTNINLLAAYTRLIKDVYNFELSDSEIVLASIMHERAKHGSYVIPKIEGIHYELVLAFGVIVDFITQPGIPHVILYADKYLDKLDSNFEFLKPLFNALRIPQFKHDSDLDTQDIKNIYTNKIVFTTPEFYLGSLLKDTVAEDITYKFSQSIQIYAMGPYSIALDPNSITIARTYDYKEESEDPFIKRVTQFVRTLKTGELSNDETDISIDENSYKYTLTEKGKDAIITEFGSGALDISTRLGGRLHAGIIAEFMMNKVDDLENPMDYVISKDNHLKLNIYIPNIKEAVESKEGLKVTYPVHVANELTFLNTTLISYIKMGFEFRETCEFELQVIGLTPPKPFKYESTSNNYDTSIELADFEQTVGQAIFLMRGYVEDLREELSSEREINLAYALPNIDLVNAEALKLTKSDFKIIANEIMKSLRNHLENYFNNIESIRGGIISGQVSNPNYFVLIDDMDIGISNAQLDALKDHFNRHNFTITESET